jgi:hypothetical protein
VRIELRNRSLLRKPTVFICWKAVSDRPLERGWGESPESETGACFHRGLPGTQESWLSPRKVARRFRALEVEPGLWGMRAGPMEANTPSSRSAVAKGKPEVTVTDSTAVLRPHTTYEGGEPQGFQRWKRPGHPLEGRGKQMDGVTQ